MHSAIYVGHVRHRRRAPANAFTFPLFMPYLDLAELDNVLSMTRLWGRSPLSPARFRRADYLGPPHVGLDESVRDCVELNIARRPTGSIRMLTNMRYFGYIFNPVTFYFCFEGERVDAVIAEITNTPWGERHAYVLDAKKAGASRMLRWRFEKRFHVSPFMPMSLEYDWAIAPPDESVLIHMNLRDRTGDKTFDATMSMRRRELTAPLMRWLLIRYPLMTAQIITKIHTEALRLWWKRAPFHRHPGGFPRRAASAVPGETTT